MDRRVGYIILAVFVILILFLYVQFGVRRNSAQITELKTVHAAVTDSLQRAKAVAARLPEMERRLAVLTKQWEKAQQMLPTEKEMPDLLSSVTRAGEKAGARFLLFQPLATKAEQHYTEIPIQISVRSTYHSLGKFLSDLGELQRIVNVSNLKVVPVAEERVTVEANFVATTYVLMKSSIPGRPSRRR